MDRAADAGSVMLAQLKNQLERLPHVGEVRGIGMMAAVELVADKATRAQYPAERKAAAEKKYAQALAAAEELTAEALAARGHYQRSSAILFEYLERRATRQHAFNRVICARTGSQHDFELVAHPHGLRGRLCSRQKDQQAYGQYAGFGFHDCSLADEKIY